MIAQLGLEKEWVQVVTGGSRSRDVGLECALKSSRWAEKGEGLQVFIFKSNASALTMLDNLLTTENHQTEHFNRNGEEFNISTERIDSFAVCTYTQVAFSALLFLQWIPEERKCRRSNIPDDREEILKRFQKGQDSQ
ncbi:MAG: hypothetical protein CMF59_04045 [Leptospiraceae bacterium]|nr:hypothetical protein [Leptospiraceae bacterium]